ncbi:MAG TPA: FG-GAP-like repeat-containing protein, partial [Gaiellaceae bacterium]|nr:FG-GAP-like repeat-containing protein [Gaiellaceae bacterium]
TIPETARGRRIYSVSVGLVLCFLAIGPERADPLPFWWGPMSVWLAVALVLIVGGGLAILRRLRLVVIAAGFWLTFAAGIAVLAATGHEMRAAWHLGPIGGLDLWWLLVTSPEILVFLFFMITDPRTIPRTAAGRRVYAIGIGLLAVMLIAPLTTEFATKVAVLGALFIVCALRPVLLFLQVPLRIEGSRARLGTYAAAGVAAFVGLVVLAGIPARPDEASAGVASARAIPDVSVLPSEDVATKLDRSSAERIARDVVANLGNEADAVLLRDPDRATAGAAGARLASVWASIDAAGQTVAVPEYDLDRMTVTLERDEGQGPPLVVADLEGTVELVTYRGSPPTVQARGSRAPYRQTLELVLSDGRYLIAGSRGPTPRVLATPAAVPEPAPATGLRLENVAAESGLRFRHGAFRFQNSSDPVASMGGGLCWLDYDDDGWLDLFVVNSYSIVGDFAQWRRRGGTPRAALFHNERGKFVDVSRGSGANVTLRGNGCVAGDLNGDGRTDLYVTATGYDALLWNRGDGTFVEGARAAGITTYGWNSGAAVGDVNRDGRADLYVTSYADMNSPVPGAAGGFPSNYRPVRDRLYLNLGPDAKGRSRFREVAEQVGVEAKQVDHGLGVVFTDYNGDGRLDLYVANDTDPNRLLENVPASGPLGFRLEERAGSVVADPQAGMGVAAADFNRDLRPDLFVTNSHRQLHGVFGSRVSGFTDARRTFAPAFDTRFAGWGVAWSDLDLDGDLDVALANGAIPVRNPAHDAEPVQVLESRSAKIVDVSEGVLGASGLRVNGRGLAAADYDNDGDVDVAINSIAGPLALLRNTGSRGHWLEVAFERFSPGARVTLELPGGQRLVREVQAGSSYLSSEDPRLHFGLGRAARVKALLARLPDGRVVRRANVAANQVVTIP